MAYLEKSRIDNTKSSVLSKRSWTFLRQKGDNIHFHAINGRAVINETTKKFNGFDLEGKEIRRRVQEKKKKIRDAEY